MGRVFEQYHSYYFQLHQEVYCYLHIKATHDDLNAPEIMENEKLGKHFHVKGEVKRVQSMMLMLINKPIKFGENYI